MEKVAGVLIMTLLEKLQFLMLIIFHNLISIIQKNNFLVLGEGPTEGINGSVGTTEKNLVLTLVKQIQTFA